MRDVIITAAFDYYRDGKVRESLAVGRRLPVDDDLAGQWVAKGLALYTDAPEHEVAAESVAAKKKGARE